GRDGHGITAGHLGFVTAKQGLAAQGAVTEVDFDAVAVQVAWHVGGLAGEKGQVPGVLIAIDQRDDGDAQSGDNEAGLFGRLVVAGGHYAAGSGDAFESSAETAKDGLELSISRSLRAVLEGSEHLAHGGVIAVESR